MVASDNFTPRRGHSNHCRSSISRSRASRKKRRFFTSWARKMTRSNWSDTRRCCTLFSRSATRHTGCRHFPPPAARETADGNRAQRNPWCGGKDGAETIEGVWECGKHSAGGVGKIEQRNFAEECRENTESAWCFDAAVTGRGGT